MVIYRPKKSKIKIIESVLRYRRYIILKLKCKKVKMGGQSSLKTRRSNWKIEMMINKLNLNDTRKNCGVSRKGYVSLLYKFKIQKKFNCKYTIQLKSKNQKRKMGVLYV